ncbi:MAG: hypothetical protein H6627_09575 [Calditrichae bacterium]|nr:hypothetical protein [Calditrichia bacterium]
MYDKKYNFLYEDSDSLLVKNLIEKIRKPLSEIENFFDLRTQAVTNIYLTRSESEFQSYAQTGFPEWSQAVALLQQKTIILRIANGDELNRVPQVLLHELVHIILGIKFPDLDIPTWIHEGIAQKLSNESLNMDEQVLIANALFSDRLYALADLDSMLSFSSVKARTGYALSRSAIDFFLDRYTKKDLLDILSQLHRKKSMDQAFSEVTGRDFVDFQVGWFAYIDEKYKWMILLNTSNLIWLIFIILIVLAYIRVKLKNKKTIRSWPEQGIDDIDKQVNHF